MDLRQWYIRNQVKGSMVFMATFLFIIPNKRSPGAKLMDWGGCKQLPWDIVLLLGGGFAEGIKTSGLSVWISQSFGFLKSTNYAFITPVIALIVSLVTEFTSNNAAATIFLPLLADVALSIHRHPLFLMLTGAISASYAFMLPISTPPNAIAYATGYLKVTDTISNGILLKCFGIATLSVLVPTLGIHVFGME